MVRVRDNHSIAGSDTSNFIVVVRTASQAPQIAASTSPEGQCVLTWSSQAGVRYRVSFQNTLQPGGSWQTLVEVDGNGEGVNHTDTGSTGVTTRFYRVEILP
jgi:hypothetical protein